MTLIKFLFICYITITYSEIILEKLKDLSPYYDKEFESYILTDKMIGLQNYLKYALHLGEKRKYSQNSI